MVEQLNVLVLCPHIGFYRHVDGVVRELLAQGHSVRLMFGEGGERKKGVTDRSIQALLKDHAEVEIGTVPRRKGVWRRVLYISRLLLDYRLYVLPNHPSPHMRTRWHHYFPRTLRRLVTSRWGERTLSSTWLASLLRRVERIAPPDPQAVRLLRAEGADIILDLTNLVFNTPEVEILKAARALGIPSIISVASWDNLTTKGTFHIMPDRVFVWNHEIADEAVRLHGVPEERILITGAPTHDYLFRAQPAVSRVEFCGRLGIRPDQKYILYLCSSVQITGDETDFVQEFTNELQKRPETAGAVVVIRPYPMNAGIWQQVSISNAVVWPAQGEFPDIQESRQDYFHQLFFSEAVIGVNTTAMLEAAIADRPCITVLTEKYRATQFGRGHFAHLVRGDFLEYANTFSEAAGLLANVLAGKDAKAENRRKFVAYFIRPNGMHCEVAGLYSQALGMVHAGKTNQEIMQAFLAEYDL